MGKDSHIKGHITAFFTVLIWGITFISTKYLLIDFSPIEILFYRFCLGTIALFIVYPRRLKGTTKKQELYFAAAGLCGVTLYYLLENIALTYSTASNVGVIVSITPIFTVLLATWFLKGEKLKASYFIGFAAAIIGICLISFNGNMVLKLNPLGDILALLAAIVWAFYSILSRQISQFGYNTIQTTRRIFCYGVAFMIPTLFFFPFEWGIEKFAQPANTLNILFLGLGASALCFATWNYSVKLLGAIKTSVYIYLVPVIAVVASIIVLNESLTWMSALGTGLTLAGLLISEGKNRLG